MASTAPRFEVVVMVANYDCYDRITGWRGRRAAVTQTAGWAHALCDRFDIDHDIYAEVREIATGKRVMRQPAPAPVEVEWLF